MRLEIECPNCGTYQKVDDDYDYFTCCLCGKEFETLEVDK